MSVEVLGIISLVVFLGTVFLGVSKNVNLGILAIGVAFLMGFFIHTEGGTMSSAALRGNPITSLFPFQIFWQTLAASLMLNVASVNGTIDIIIKRMVSVAKGRRAIIPVVVFVAMMIACTVGAGTIGVVVLLCTIAANIAKDQDIDPVFMLLSVMCGSTVGVGSPFATIGIMCNSFSEETWGKQIALSYIYPRAVVMAVLSFGVVYFIFKGWKLKRREVSDTDEYQKLNKKQWITVTGMIAFILLSIVFELEIGLSAFLVTAVLLLFKCADEKEVISQVSWASILLICGMCILIGMVDYAGGMDLLTGALKKLMNGFTVKPIYSLIGGLLGLVSPATGVVLPSMLPTIPEIAEATNVNPYALVTALAYGTNITCVSPFASMGAISLGIMSANANWNTADLFKSMLKMSLILMVAAMVWTAIGVAG